jgi:putative transposase
MSDAQGIPIALVVCGANQHDVTMLEDLLDAQIIEKPATAGVKSHLCLDAGYISPDTALLAEQHGMEAHVRPRGEEIAEKAEGKKPRRWVVERTHSWMNRYRRLLIRWEKRADHYLQFIQLACCLLLISRLFVG